MEGLKKILCLISQDLGLAVDRVHEQNDSTTVEFGIHTKSDVSSESSYIKEVSEIRSTITQKYIYEKFASDQPNLERYWYMTCYVRQNNPNTNLFSSNFPTFHG